MTSRLFMVAVAMTMIVACGGPPQSTADPKSSFAQKGEVTLSAEQQREGGIEVQPVAATDQPESLTVTGRIAFADNRTWRVGVPTDGIVVAAPVGLGDFVRAGQQLASFQAVAVRDARAQYQSARADLASAESAATLAQRNVDRAQKLLELKAGSVVQVEQARQDLAAAQAARQRSQAEVTRLRDLLQRGFHVVPDAGGDPEIADRAPIIAPASGYVVEKNVTLGRAVRTEDDAFVIGDLSEVWMLASVRQEQLGRLRLGQDAHITVNGLAASFPGRISNLGQQLDETTGTMAVRIALKNPNGVLRPGMLGMATIAVGGHQSVVSVPSDALQQVNGEDVVFVRVADDRFVVRPVKIGGTADGRTPILEGLKAGEPLVVRGSFVLKSQLLRASLEERE